MTQAVFALLFVLAAYQVYVSVLLARSEVLTRSQCLAQIGIVWLLPAVGAVVCHWFYRLHSVHEQPAVLGYRKPHPMANAESGPINDLTSD